MCLLMDSDKYICSYQPSVINRYANIENLEQQFTMHISGNIIYYQSNIKVIQEGDSTIMQFSVQQPIEVDFHVPKIENVVGTFTLDTKQPLRLGDIASKWSHSRYNKRRFSGLIARNEDPKATFMIFSNGKVIVTGARSQNQCELSSTKLIKKMSKIGLLKSLKPKTALQIRNIVATVNTKLSINLDQLKSKNPREASYVPEVFPGLIFKMKNYKATFLVFSNGKIVINGVQTEAQATTYFRAFFKILKKFKTRGPAPKTN